MPKCARAIFHAFCMSGVTSIVAYNMTSITFEEASQNKSFKFEVSLKSLKSKLSEKILYEKRAEGES